MITNDNPVTIPAVAEKTFDEQWVYNLIVHAPTPTTGRVAIELLPYNEETKEIGPSQFMQSFSTDKLWEAVEEVPEMQAAFAAIIAAVPAMKAWLAAQQNQEQAPNA